MSAGQISVPIVFRGPNGAAAGVGAQHSQVKDLTTVVAAGYLGIHHSLIAELSKDFIVGTEAI